MEQAQGGGGGLGTRTDQMERSALHVGAVQAAITAQLGGLRQRLAEMPGLWVGDAGRGFVALMARWDEDARALASALEAIGTQIRTSGAIYQTNEDTQVQAVNKVGGAMSGISQALRA